MPPVNRNAPRRAKSSESTYTLMDFQREFPDDTACLDWLWRRNHSADGQTAHCPKCDRDRRFHRVASRPSYSCDSCGHHIHPTAGTIFHKSSTSLALWFHAIFLMSQTRCGISAKQLERDLGVTYKTAWRMFHKIREMLTDDDDPPLSGEVEVDETAGGAKHVRAGDSQRGLAMVKKSQRPTIWGAVERGGRVRVRVVNSRGTLDVERPIFEHVLPSSMVFTDEWGGYTKRIGQRYASHRRIRHESRVYVEGPVHTQTIEGFFGLMKNGIRGVYHAVSEKHLQSYLDEYAFRYNHRKNSTPMFRLFLHTVTREAA